jgi:vanillate O-demethylase ferredoxin subunit
MAPIGADALAQPRRRVRVLRRAVLADDIVLLHLQAVDGRPLPSFDPGAHVDLHLPNGLVRPYSLCHAPTADGVYRVAVLRETAGRGGSAGVHALLVPGCEFDIGWPRNQFGLRAVPHALLLAGGIGITPLLSMAEALVARGASFELHACARHRGRAAFFDELACVPWRDSVHWHLDDGSDSQRLHIDDLLRWQPEGAEVWVCGPAGFISHVLQACDRMGWSPARVHVERFQAPAAARGQREAGSGTSGAGFDLVWAPSGQRVRVAEGRSAALALRDAGLPVSLSCEQGVCGACVLRVLQGRPAHRDLYFSAPEHAANDRFTPCCSRSLDPLLVVAPL